MLLDISPSGFRPWNYGLTHGLRTESWIGGEAQVGMENMLMCSRDISGWSIHGRGPAVVSYLLRYAAGLNSGRYEGFLETVSKL
jgi:hypothetical protein